MKTFLLATLFTTAIFTTAEAQTAAAPVAKTMTKAEKDAAKAKKETDLLEAFAKAAFSAEEQTKYRAEVDAGNDKVRPIKADASLTEEDKKIKTDVINKERNDNLKTMLGEAKYKLFKATQKAQREAAIANGG